MPIRFGPIELIIILAIIVLLFGVGRIGKIAKEMGTGIRSFKDSLNGNDNTESELKTTDEEKE